MKKNLTFITLILALPVLLLAGESKVQKHHLHFSITNAMSDAFAVVGGKPRSDFTRVYNGFYYDSTHFVYKPAYTLNLQFKYSYDVCRFFSIQAGIGYLWRGENVDEPTSYQMTDGVNSLFGIRSRTYGGYVTLPFEFRFMLPLNKNKLSLTVGTHLSFITNGQSHQFVQLGGLGSGDTSKTFN